MRKLGQRRVPDKVHPFVATPAYDGKVDSQYAQSLAEAAFTSPLHQVYFSQCVMGNGAFIDLARNIFVKMFLEENKECSHLFFIDADLRFEARAFIGLAKAGLPICAGVYPRRQDEPSYPARWVPHPEQGGLWVEDGFVMCDRVPTGFLCIERKVVEEMAEDAIKMYIPGQKGPVPRLFYTELKDTNKFTGEDFCFCDDYVKKYNQPIPVWPDMDFTHGRWKGNYHAYLAEQIKKAEEEKELSAA